MCGIAGFTHRNGAYDPGRIQSAIAEIIHRGPDQQGVFESDSVSLGATRLKILDLETGSQPIVSETGGAVIVFNGEIYNYQELRRDLESRGHHFRTSADTEVVLAAFLEWDVECFSRLRGMFAVALWTEANRRLVLARDRVGIKPLYLARHQGDLFFGSELKAILVHPQIERRLCLAGLDCYLALNYVPYPWTLLEGIEKLRPGCWLEWVDGRERAECYWRLPAASARGRDFDSANLELDQLLRDSARDHMLADVPVGVWLSGGIDSSTILHYASEASGSRLKTFSISFRGRSFDESKYIGGLVSRYGTDHAELDVNAGSRLEEAIEQFAYYSDEPDADAGALPVWFLSKLTKRTATVALSGEGADELFGGYLTYRANRLARWMRMAPRGALRLALKGLSQWPVSDEKISFEYQLKRFLEGCQMTPARAHVYWNGTFTEQQKRRLVRPYLPPALDAILGDVHFAGRNSQDDLWFDQQYFLPDDILTKVDRMSMAHAVEVRPPFLDHRIVEFAAGLPLSFKIRGSRLKVILKELMKGKLPPEILRRKKVGFDIPAHEWLRGPLRALLFDTIAEGEAAYPDLFDRETLKALVTSHVDRRANLGYHLWGIMILLLWMKKWRVQMPAAALPVPRVAETIYTSI